MGEITIAQDANEIGPQSLQKEIGHAILNFFPFLLNWPNLT